MSQNISNAWTVNGYALLYISCSHQSITNQPLHHFFQKILPLSLSSRTRPCVKNPVLPNAEDAVVNMATEFPGYGQERASNELRKRGIIISGGGVGSVWMRHGIETFKKRLKSVEATVAKEAERSTLRDRNTTSCMSWVHKTPIILIISKI